MAAKGTGFVPGWQEYALPAGGVFYVKHRVIVLAVDYFLANAGAIRYRVAPAGGARTGLRQTLGT